MLVFWRKILIDPGSKNKDTSRREFILNILLVALIFLSATAFLENSISWLLYYRKVGENPIIPGFITGIFIVLLFLSRKGKSYISASLFVSLLFIIVTYSNYKWGADLPINLLLSALIIVMGGVLIGTRFAFFVTIFSMASVTFFSYLEIIGVIHPNRIRKLETIRMADSLVYIIILAIIAIISWLFNRESEKALKRARISEATLQNQKDKLEMLVEKRTWELKQAQAEKLTQLYRFAEFGRMASGLFHDLVNPLELVALNLDRLSKKSRKMNPQEIKRLLDRAMLGMKQLEGFILAARKQMQHQEVLQFFSMSDEITQVMHMLTYKAKKAHIHITLYQAKEIQIFGSVIKFGQLITNLITNAIDAYEADTKNDRRIEIHLQKLNKHVRLTVQDWASGIQKKYLPKIFDPLFTTKSFEKGTGMGLAICRDIMKKDFKGEIQVTSKENKGTMFTLIFPIKKVKG